MGKGARGEKRKLARGWYRSRRGWCGVKKSRDGLMRTFSLKFRSKGKIVKNSRCFSWGRKCGVMSKCSGVDKCTYGRKSLSGNLDDSLKHPCD